ncbi:OsmC family protein [Benzoatithermus flavus]|uniref:OsmC family protein n=1 Tax=Benzoatithermus flavus TaxID=3108223 RepID=A0ABU8XU08_9PROT
MRARIKWVEGRTFVGESGSGHGLVIDGPAEAGGRNLGPSPMELVLIGTGGCTAFDVVEILKKGRHAVEDCEVRLEAERAAEPPRVFTRIRMRFVVTGRSLPRAAVERAVTLSAEKYCSASIMLAKTAEITHEIEIRESAAADRSVTRGLSA